MITLLLLVRATNMYGVVFHTHPVRGESHNQRNTTGEVATAQDTLYKQQACEKVDNRVPLSRIELLYFRWALAQGLLS